MSNEVSLLAGVLKAGALSALSPCVLPLLPPLAALFAGYALSTVSDDERGRFGRRWRRAMLGALLAIAGFVAMFIVLSAPALAIQPQLAANRSLLALVAGVLIAVSGAELLLRALERLFGWTGVVLDPYRRLAMPLAPLIGAALYFGWTTCVGPVLGPILSLASAPATLGSGIGLLAVYAGGLAVALLLFACAVAAISANVSRPRAAVAMLEVFLAVGLLLTGFLVPRGGMQVAGAWLIDNYPVIATIEERTASPGLPLEIMKRAAQ
jgi:cytochrome c-type biogenesis protein